MNSPAEIASQYIETGRKKAETPFGRMFLLAFLAGMYIAIAGVAATICNNSFSKLVGSLVFPAGLAMILVAGAELFTGDCLMIISCVEKKISAGKLAVSLLTVYLGNFAGSLFVTAMAVCGGTLDGCAEAVVATASAKVGMSFSAAFIRGVMCNIIVCVAVWMAFAAKTASGKIICSYMPIMVFVMCGFEHCVANMFYIPAGILEAARNGLEAGTLGIGSMFTGNLIPVTAGNIVGGFLVAMIYWCIYLKGRKTEGK